MKYGGKRYYNKSELYKGMSANLDQPRGSWPWNGKIRLVLSSALLVAIMQLQPWRGGNGAKRAKCSIT
jgi:hypothetical protein